MSLVSVRNGPFGIVELLPTLVVCMLFVALHAHSHAWAPGLPHKWMPAVDWSQGRVKKNSMNARLAACERQGQGNILFLLGKLEDAHVCANMTW